MAALALEEVGQPGSLEAERSAKAARTADFRAAAPDHIAGWVREAVEPAVEAAKAVLERLKEIGPDQVELKFGIKVSGGASVTMSN